MEGVPENALQPLDFVTEMLDTETSQLACADTQTHVFHEEIRHGTVCFMEIIPFELARRRRITA